jgi:uncharacterized protein
MGKRKRKAKADWDHDSVVADWRQHAELHDDANYKFLRSMKHRQYGFEPDQVAKELHEQAFTIIDCTRCANCCKTMNVTLDGADIERLSTHLGMTPNELTEAYLEWDKDQWAYQIRKQPCPFLGADDRCTVYNVRPTCCREYPHTDKDEFVCRTTLHANSAKLCPAVFWIVEEMRRRAKE